MTSASSAPAAPESREASVLNAAALRALGMPAVLVALWVFFALLTPQFLSARNLSMLMIELSATAILAVGVLLVLLPGHTDLSVGAGAGLTGGIASVLIFKQEWPAPAALGVAFAAGIVLWFLMGLFIVRNRLQAFIITLGGMLAFQGVFWLIIRSATVPVARGGETNVYSLLTTYYLPDWAGWALAMGIVAALTVITLWGRQRRAAAGLANERAELPFLRLFVAAQALALVVLVCSHYRGLPLAFVILCLVAAVVHVLTRHTPFGRHLYAIGGNEEATIVSGIPVQRTVVIAFTLLGGIVAIAGFISTAYAGASTTTIGNQMELDAIAACVIGGTSLKGGRGTVLGALFGALIMATLLNGMTLLAVPPEYKMLVRGIVLVLAVWVDSRLGGSR